MEHVTGFFFPRDNNYSALLFKDSRCFWQFPFLILMPFAGNRDFDDGFTKLSNLLFLCPEKLRTRLLSTHDFSFARVQTLDKSDKTSNHILVKLTDGNLLWTPCASEGNSAVDLYQLTELCNPAHVHWICTSVADQTRKTKPSLCFKLKLWGT